MANDLRIELRFKNAVLGRALSGQFGEMARQAQSGPVLPLIKVASEAIGVSRMALSALLNLKDSPWNAKGQRLPVAEKIAGALSVDFDELFPVALYSGRFSSAKIAEFSSPRLLPIKDAMRLPAADAESEFELAEQSNVLSTVLDALKPREREVVAMRFGLNDGHEHTLDEVGKRLGVTGQRVRQIEARALRKLRHPQQSARLIDAGLMPND